MFIFLLSKTVRANLDREPTIIEYTLLHFPCLGPLNIISQKHISLAKVRECLKCAWPQQLFKILPRLKSSTYQEFQPIAVWVYTIYLLFIVPHKNPGVVLVTTVKCYEKMWRNKTLLIKWLTLCWTPFQRQSLILKIIWLYVIT